MRDVNAIGLAGNIPDYISNLEQTGNDETFTDLDPLSPKDTINSTVESGIRLVQIGCLDEETGTSAGVIGNFDLILASLTNLHTAGDENNQSGIASDQRQRFTVNFTLGQKGVCSPEEEIAESADIPVPGTVGS